MTATDEYIAKLAGLGPGALGLLRAHSGSRLDEDVAGFDLFAGLWWPLREKNQRAPRREVAWLVAKLYAAHPIQHLRGAALPVQLGRLHSRLANPERRQRAQDMFDALLSTALDQLEPALKRAVSELQRPGASIDWVKLTDDLSVWERESTRMEWAEHYLLQKQGATNVD